MSDRRSGQNTGENTTALRSCLHDKIKVTSSTMWTDRNRTHRASVLFTWTRWFKYLRYLNHSGQVVTAEARSVRLRLVHIVVNVIIFSQGEDCKIQTWGERRGKRKEPVDNKSRIKRFQTSPHFSHTNKNTMAQTHLTNWQIWHTRPRLQADRAR